MSSGISILNPGLSLAAKLSGLQTQSCSVRFATGPSCEAVTVNFEAFTGAKMSFAHYTLSQGP